MISNAMGFKPAANLLKGMRGSSGYGEAMAAASNLNLEATEANTKKGLEERGLQNQRDQQKNKLNAQGRESCMQFNASNTKSSIEKGTAQTKNMSDNLHRNRKNHWDMKNTLLQGLYT